MLVDMFSGEKPVAVWTCQVHLQVIQSDAYTCTPTRSCTTSSPNNSLIAIRWGTWLHFSEISQNPQSGVYASSTRLPASSRVTDSIGLSVKAHQYHRENLNQTEVNQYDFNLLKILWTHLGEFIL